MDAIFSINLHELIVNPRLFFYLGIYTGIAIVFYEGYRRKIPFTDWTFVITFSLICALIASKLITYNASEWQALLRFSFPESESISLIGWRIGVLAGAIISVRIIGISRGSFDTIAYAFPVGLIITRIGCLIGGCCYGTPVESFFTVNYSGSPENLHPVQFYEMLLCLVMIATNYLLQKNNFFKKPGNLGLFTMMFYFFFRFFIEFIRAGGVYAGGLKIIQWISLIAVVLFALFIIVFEKRYSSSGVYKREKKHYSETVLIFSGTMLSAFAFSILSYFESVLLASLIIMFLINYLQKIIFITADYKIFRNQVAMIVVSVLFMSFTINHDSIVHNHAENSDVEIVATDESDKVLDYVKYTSDIGMGVYGGKYRGICGNTYDYTYFNIDYEGRFSFDAKHNMYFKFGVFNSYSSSLTSSQPRQYSYLGSTQLIGYSNKRIKVGIGFIGALSSKENSNIEYEGDNYQIFPAAELRVGEKYFFDGSVGYFYNPEWGLSLQAGWGYRFNNMSNISIGFGMPVGVYFNGMFFIGDKVYVSPYVSYFDSSNLFFGGKLGVRFPSGN